MIIIPGQGGTYRHSRGSVAHLLAESGQSQPDGPGPHPPATRTVAKLLAGTVRDAFHPPTRRPGHRLATSELPRSGRRIDTTYCAKKLGEPPGLAARIGPGDHRPGAVPRRQRDRLRAQLLAMGGLRRRRPARSTAVWQVRSLVCGDRVTVVCGWLVGNAQRRHQQGQPWSPPKALDAKPGLFTSSVACCLASRRSALASAAWGWHTAGCGDRIGPRGRTAFPWVAAENSDTDGASSGLVGVCALV